MLLNTNRKNGFNTKIYVFPQNLKSDNFDDQTVKKSNLPKIKLIYSLLHKKIVLSQRLLGYTTNI